MPARSPSAIVDYCGEEYLVPGDGVLTIGRDADVDIDDNPYLHRRFIELAFQSDILWITNVGSTSTATLSDGDGLVQTWLSPGARLPVLFPQTIVWFTAGPTTYDFEIKLDAAPFLTNTDVSSPDEGETTLGRVSLTPDQRLIIVALAEDLLRRGNRGSGTIPPSSAAAQRLGWTITKFNRKLDNVCEKFSKLGVRGLIAEAGRPASNRKARLVEYCLASRVITRNDLAWLDAAHLPKT